MKHIFNLIFCLLNFGAISQNIAISQITSFVRPNYKIKFPNTWIIDTSKIKGTEFFICEKSEIKSIRKSEIVTLILQNLRGQNIDIIRYKEITERQIAGLGYNGKIFKSIILQSTSGPYFKMESYIKQNNRTLKSIQICFIKNEKAYLLTFTSDLDKFEQFKKVGEEIINSFSVSN